MISFVVPYHRNRVGNLKYLPSNFLNFYPDSEIIIAEQNDDKPFKRGQLCNLGFKESLGDIIVFIDVDIRFLNELDIVALVESVKRPFLPWDHRSEVREEGGVISLLNERIHTLQGFGGCSVFTRNQFENSFGFSNLCEGWGAEDTILNLRVGGYSRLKGDLFHIKHPSFRDTFDPNKDELVINNRRVLATHADRPPKNDSLNHTVAECFYAKSENKRIKHCQFTNISVSEDFIY
jgi:glycosyltransferase involved in cell wall biosynthesis